MPQVKTDICRRVRAALVELQPATANEVAEKLGVSHFEASRGIWILKNRKHLRPCGHVRNPDAPGPGVRLYFKLYELTTFGRAAARQDRRPIEAKP